MPETRTPPFRAEHVGSLLRPAALRQAHRAHAAGEMSDADFRAAQDAAVRAAVEMQEELGFRAVTDGEFRRISYWAHFVDAVDGLDVAEARFAFRDETGAAHPFLAPVVTGPVRHVRSISGDEFAFLKATARALPKLTMPSPPTLHFWAEADAPTKAGYADPDAVFADLAAVYVTEVAALAEAGATYIQLDDVPFVQLCDPAIRRALADRGADPDALVDAYVALTNACLAGRPAGVTVALHVCRGNFKGRHLAEGGYDAVAERLFRGLEVDAYFLEYDTPRAGDFAPLAAMPDDKTVVLGLVSSKVPDLEETAALKARIGAAARHVAMDRLALSPQCGFASAVSGNPVTEADQRAKLARVAEVAAEVWG